MSEDMKEPSVVVAVPNPNDDASKKTSTSDLQFQPQTGETLFSWDALNVWNKKPKVQQIGAGGKSEPKQLLKNVSGAVRSGQFLALMGASGAGKTTLLNVLHFNSGKLYVEGQRCINGVPTTSAHISSCSAYVQQEDLFIPTLTVREHLIFTSRVRISGKSTAERLQCVDAIIHDLGLTKCQHTRIGNPARAKGISGGEMKRLAFASEFLTDPLILFCDEPTSGLDSFMAQSIVKVMQKMAQAGKSIICTIHQPASEVFEMFNHIYLLSSGRVAFSGSTNEALDFFDKCGYPCELNHNPADFFIFTLAITPGDEVKCRARATAICDAFEASDKHKELQIVAKYRTPEVKQKNHFLNFTKGTKYKTNPCVQFNALIRRSYLSTIREPMLFVARIVSTTFMALLISLVFMNQQKDQSGVKNINGCLVILPLVVFIITGFAVVFVICDESPVFLREHWNGMYRTDVYYLAKVLTEIPFFIFFTVLFVAIVYHIIGFNPDLHRFLWCFVIMITMGHCSTGFGYMFANIFRKLTVVLTALPCFMIMLLIYSGFFLREEAAPVFLRWIKDISFFYYSFELVFVNQYDGMENIGTVPNATFMQFTEGSMVLEFFGFKKANWTRDFVSMAVLGVVYHLISYLFLLYRTYARK